MSRTRGHAMHRYVGHKEFLLELAVRKARVEVAEAEEVVIDHDQRRREFAEARMLRWAGHDEAQVARFAATLRDGS